jgi:protein SCO1/2
MIVALWLLACTGGDTYIVEGTVVEIHGPNEIVLDHDPIHGPGGVMYMDRMTMPFAVRDAHLAKGLVPGDRVTARLVVEQDGTHLEAIRVTGKGVLPPPAEGTPPLPLRAGEILERVDVEVEDGTSVVIGDGQGIATAVAFVYTTCPLPEFCPAVVTRLQSLQEKIGTDARIVAITIDPEHDTTAVLAEFASKVGAKKETWRFGRLPPDRLEPLAWRAALSVTRDGTAIEHGLRLLVLDRDGRLVERYDDARWPIDRVAEQLRTGGPPAPDGTSGTVTPQ